LVDDYCCWGFAGNGPLPSGARIAKALGRQNPPKSLITPQ
jgi:hypothetical protein